jgi:UDP-N-acetylglucosamine 4,6-dehydratase/5-epimerase
MFNNSKIFISGATGSWGQTLVTQLLQKYNVKEIVCFSRGELQQVLMNRKFNDKRLKFIIGDIRDYDSVRNATKGVDYIFHLAALKHVPVCEENVQETIKTNITGTTNIVNAAIENRVKKVIDVSSDKAVEPINLYGMTKAVGEKIIIQANELTDYTKFVCIRGGNVMGSSGSVIPFFIDKIKNNNPIPITHLMMTRFFLTLEEAISLLFKASENSIGGETFVMNMPACYIKDLAEVLMDEYGKVSIEDVGIRPGEKLDEMLISKNETALSYCYDENYYVILPPNYNANLKDRYTKLTKFTGEEFSSRTYIMDKPQIYEMLTKGRFI